MITNPALGVNAARTRTRILTTLTDTSLVGGALRAQHALWPAVGRQTYVELQAGAHSLTVEFATLGIGTAGRGTTRLSGFGQTNC